MPETAATDYILAHWERSFYSDSNGSGFLGDDLPFPYTSPCIKGEGKFSFFFYWDTYFTNLGLLAHGHADMARNNIRNMLWLIRRQGYMPNHVGLFNRSQPPYLCRMVDDYFVHIGGPERDPDFFGDCVAALRQEYNFWMASRLHGCGLNRFGHCGTWEDEEKFAANKRVSGIQPNAEKSLEERREIGGHFLAEAESGCDFTPRFELRCRDYIPAELNALLYEYEVFFQRCAERFAWKEFRPWEGRASRRRELINRYLWSDARGLFLDYDTANGRHSPVAALSGVQLLASGIPDSGQAARIVSNLPLFERDHGIAYTEELPDLGAFQWAYPAVWPPMVWMCVTGLDRYGYRADARRIAEKFVRTTDSLFAATGKLWEKTDAAKGVVAAAEYDAAPMMGWSAGVYVACQSFLS